MKLFGFYISRHNWKYKYSIANNRAIRNAKETTQYADAWREERKELNKTIAQMEAARETNLRARQQFEQTIQLLKKERGLLKEQLEEAERDQKSLEAFTADLDVKLAQERDALKYEKDLNRVTNNNYKAERKANEEKVAGLQDYITELEKQVEELKHELTAAKRLNSECELKKRVSELEKACDKLIDENTEYGSLNEKLKLQVSSQKELLVELQIELDSYKKRHEHKVELRKARQKKYRENKKANENKD